MEYKHRLIFSSSVEGEIYERFKEVCWRERKQMNVLFQEFMEKYIKEHSQGNPQYEIGQWVENPDFRAVPAFREPLKNWTRYINTETSYQDARDDYEKAFWIYKQYDPILKQLIIQGKRVGTYIPKWNK